jgi:hypothetical protein
MKIKQLNTDTIMLQYPTIEDMNNAMYRISEFSEGVSGFKDKYFTRNKFLKRYTNDYFTKWEGHNIPKTTLNKFQEVYQQRITKEEGEVILIAHLLSDTGYLIALVEGDTLTQRHEEAHALFHCNKGYRDEVIITISNFIQLKVAERYINHLKENDYHDDVLVDEMNAYLVGFSHEECDEMFPTVYYFEIEHAHIALSTLFDKWNMHSINFKVESAGDGKAFLDIEGEDNFVI